MMSISQTAVALLKVPMGGIGYAKGPDELETLLGSCVGVAIWDRTTGHGGLAHVVLPESRGGEGPPGKYADTAVAEMRRELVSRGANPLGMKAKIAGGATMFGQRKLGDVGQRNCEAVVQYLQEHKIAIVGQHLGGNQGRVIRFSLEDGSVRVFVAREEVALI